ncbi:hypothetical protein [Paraprevotella clara]|uniref:Uncharacterized protein n=1 Tax=Paraprevotella clara YIT 11840 TaxID=762968 RepID=G5ST01_9BACT|nr:hypothetical protein [Paraprevotella clara]EHG99788.1 hypothetical protein HMPREF9441_02501 [Paraprevotella clara YIT 11840]
MKQEELMESIYGCLERIENKVNGLSMPQSADGDSEVGISVNDAAIQEFKQELNGIKTSFSRLAESVSAIRGDTADLLKQGSITDKAMDLLFAVNNEYQQSRNQQNDCYNRIIRMLADLETKQAQESEDMKSLLRATNEHIKDGVYYEKHHSFSIESPFAFWGFCGMFAMIVVLAVALYFAKHPDYDRIDNDLKYRYIKMKGEITPNGISELENIFELNRDNDKIRQMRKDVESYEEAVRRRSALAEQARLKEQAAKEQEDKAKSIKSKPIQTDKPKK